MATVTSGTTASIYCPLAGDIVVTPGQRARVRVENPRGNDSFSQADITAARTFSVAAGETLFIEAVGADVNYSTPAQFGGTVTGYTAAQLSALAAAGGLTPWASYVASDTGRRLVALSASQLASADTAEKTRICFFGDSITQNAVGKAGMNYVSVTGSLTASFVVLNGDIECNGDGTANRDGTLTYDATAKTLTWRAPAGDANNGDSIGTPVDASKDGYLYVPSGTAGKGLWLVWLGKTRTYTSGSVTITMAYNGFQAWVGGANCYGLQAYLQAGARFELAAMPASAPPYMAGFYGLGGCSSSELLGASEQISQIVSDVDVIQIGTNDFAASVTVAQYLANVQALIDLRLATGTSHVVWTTILPRNTDSASTRARKAACAAAMRTFASTRAGRVSVYDIASCVTDPATGNWLSGYTVDNIHPGTLAAALIGRDLGAYLAGLIRLPTRRDMMFVDAYDATDNPTGNLLTTAGYALMNGTGGTLGTGAVTVPNWAATTAYVAGNPVLANGNLYVCVTAGTSGASAPFQQCGTVVDGTVTWLFIARGASAGIATGWTANRSSGTTLTIACAKVARIDGVPGDWQALCCYVSGGAATEIGRMRLSAAVSTGVVAGMKPDLTGEVTLAASSNLRVLDMYDGGNGYTARALQALGAPGSSDAWPTLQTPLSLTLRAPPAYVSPTGITGIQPYLQMQFTTTGWAVLLVGRVGVRRLS